MTLAISNSVGRAALKAHLASIFAISATPIALYCVKFQVDTLKLWLYVDWIPPIWWDAEGYIIAGTLTWLAVYWTPNKEGAGK